jgi:DNA-binding NtrC family response regulator
VRILIVEDDDLWLTALRAFLEQHGHAVLTARSALDALTVIASVEQIDVAIIDFELAGSLNGNDIAIKLKQRRPGCARFICTGHSEARIREQWRDPFESLYLQFVTKPLSPSRLLNELEKVRRSKEDTPPRGRLPKKEDDK